MNAADRAGLHGVNMAFYDGVEALDLDAMDGLWLHGDDVWCVHPGGDRIDGWGPVRRSWAAIFAGTSYLQFIVTDVECVLGDRLGAVTCTENILSADGPDLGATRTVATNLYAWRDDRWRMLAHHASPVLRRAVSP